MQDCDDDGESHAGSRMLHLLEIVAAEDALVVVSRYELNSTLRCLPRQTCFSNFKNATFCRWYGGTLLGPDRFKHINNAAR